MISPAEISKLAHGLGVGDRVIEKDYVLSWLLIAIAENELRHRLAFKGGTALKKCYYSDYRFSEDLDFTLIVDLSHDALVNDFKDLFPWLGRQVNLILSMRSAEQSIFESTTLLIDYVGPLRAQLGSRNLKVDVTRGELLLYPPLERPLQASYSDYPAAVTVPTYTLEEILTEKLCALMGRTEPRDLYDVYWLFEWSDVDTSFLPANFVTKCRHKGHDPKRLHDILTGKTEVFDRLWAPRLAVQVSDLPHLNEILRIVRRHLRGLGLI
jgi:predicted nucleotidyltransferase component of viral defense system